MERQFVNVHSVRHAILIINRERLAPIALAAEDSVTQAVVCLSFTNAEAFKLLNHAEDSVFDCQSVEELGVYQHSIFSIERLCPFGHIGHFLAGFCNHLNDRKLEMSCEGEVAAIVGRHCHDSAGAVTHEHIVGDPDRNLGAVERVDGVRA